MEELQNAREETKQHRAELEEEFNEDRSGNDDPSKPREKPMLSGHGIEKRKREIEERRKAIEAKRRKKDGGGSSQAVRNEPSPSQESLSPERSAADNFLAILEADLMKQNV